MSNHAVVYDVSSAMAIIRNSDTIAIDLETGGLNPWRDPIAVVTLYSPKHNTVAILHVRGHFPEELRDFMNSDYGASRLWIGHNSTVFDAMFLANAGVNVCSMYWYDTIIGEEATITSGRKNVSRSLQATISRRTGKKIKKDKGLSAWMAENLDEDQLRYCAEDVLSLPRIREEQHKKVHLQPMADALDIEMQLIPVVMKMMINGWPINLDKLAEYTKQQAINAQKAQAVLFERFGDINCNSPAQIKRAFESIGIYLSDTQKATLSTLKHFSSGEVSTLIEAVLDAKYGRKRAEFYDEEFVSTFVEQATDGTHRIHPRIQQLGTETGRWTNADPNMQQWPRDGRGVIGHVPGYKIVSGDYSQIEILTSAVLGRDAKLLEALDSGDVHRYVASQVYGVPMDQVTGNQRQTAKAMSFTLMFVGGAETMYNYARANGADITLDKAREDVTKFFERFSGLAAFRQKAIDLAQTRRSVSLTLPTGLRRTLFGDMLKPTIIANTTVQGTAAAGLKFALLEARKRGITDYLIGQVHDELVGLVPEAEAQEWSEALKECMIEGMYRALAHRPRVSIAIGDEWGK